MEVTTSVLIGGIRKPFRCRVVLFSSFILFYYFFVTFISYDKRDKNDVNAANMKVERSSMYSHLFAESGPENVQKNVTDRETVHSHLRFVSCKLLHELFANSSELREHTQTCY